MSFFEHHESYGSPNANVSPQAIRQHCIAEVEHGIIELENSSLSDSDALSQIFVDKALTAAAMNDLDEVDYQIAKLASMRDVEEYHLIEACYAGISILSEYALATLHTKLSEERDEASRQSQLDQDVLPFPEIDTVFLDSLVDMCGKNNMAPNAWIEEYSINDQKKWQTYADYYYTMIDSDSDTDAQSEIPVTMYRELLERKGAELIEHPDFSDEFVLYQIARIMTHVQDLEIKHRLTQRVMEIAQRIPIESDAETYLTLLSVGNDILQTPSLLADSSSELFVEFLNESVVRQSDPKFINPTIQFEWIANYQLHKNSSSDEIINHINSFASHLLNLDLPDSRDSFSDTQSPNSDQIFRERDARLGKLATHFAKEGDLESARLFLSQIGLEDERENALRNCLDYANAPSDVDLLRPHPESIDVHPAHDIWIKMTEKRLTPTGDVFSGLAELAVEYAQTISKEKNAKLQCIKIIHEQLLESDSQRGLVVTKELVSALRSAGVPYNNYYLQNLSDTLISNLDQDEPRIVYQEIVKDTVNAGRHKQLYALWRLANLIPAN